MVDRVGVNVWSSVVWVGLRVGVGVDIAGGLAGVGVWGCGDVWGLILLVNVREIKFWSRV